MAFESLSQKLTTAFKKLRGKGKLSEEDIKLAMREVRIALLEADVNILVAKDFVKTVSERALGAEVMDSLTPAQQVIKIVNEELTALMGSENSRIKFANHGPTVIMMCGLQAAGKTTNKATDPWLRLWIFTVRLLSSSWRLLPSRPVFRFSKWARQTR